VNIIQGEPDKDLELANKPESAQVMTDNQDPNLLVPNQDQNQSNEVANPEAVEM